MAKFCGDCGAALVLESAEPMRQPLPKESEGADSGGDKRPITVLFTDISGFTRLTTALGSEETHRFLAGFFEVVDGIVREYGGTVARHIGDNVMALFGAPVAHDNDPERAARASVAIHQAVRRLGDTETISTSVHVGIAAGEVMASVLGSRHYSEYSVSGDAANRAARLLDKAKPAETIIDAAVYRAIEHIAECVPLGDLTLKGIEHPVTAWRLDGMRSAPNREAKPTFVNREVERAQLNGILQACLQSGKGAVVFIRGDPGIGKSRLVSEVISDSKRMGFRCHAGFIVDFGSRQERDVLRAVAASLLEAPPDADAPVLTQGINSAIRNGFIATDQGTFLYDLLGLPLPQELRTIFDAMDDTTRMRGREQTAAALVSNISLARGPLMMVIEDVHWADAITLRYLAALARATTKCHALLVATTRLAGDPVDASWRASIEGGSFVTIDLGALNPCDALSLANELRVSAGEQFLHRCVERAGGNPLFLEQLIRAAAQSDVDRELPDSLRSLILARADRLPPGDKAALQTASIAGQRLPMPLLRALIDDADTHVAALTSLHLLRRDGEECWFAHALIRDGVYASLPRHRRRELHRRAADWWGEYDLTQRAEHLERAEDERTAGGYHDAAVAEAAACHLDRSLSLADRGLSVVRDQSDRYALQMLRGELLRETGHAEESIAAHRAALESAADPLARCRAFLGVASGCRVVSAHDEALAALDEAEPLASAGSHDRELAQLHYYRGSIRFARGDTSLCIAEHQRALEAAERANDPEWIARAMSGLGDGYYAGARMITARDAFRRCVEVCEASGVGSGRLAIPNRVMVGHARYFLLDFAGGLDDMMAALDAAVRIRNSQMEMFARQSIGLLLTQWGHYDEAQSFNAEALALCGKLGSRRFESLCLLQQATCRLAEGQRNDAAILAEQAIAIARNIGMGFCGAWALGLLARATVNVATRGALLADGEALLSNGCVGHNAIGFYREAIETALQHVELTEAERYADALLHYTRSEPLPLTDLLADRATAIAAYTRGDRSSATLGNLRSLREQARRAGLRISFPEAG